MHTNLAKAPELDFNDVRYEPAAKCAGRKRLIIVADDVTGAADCASRCHHAGLPAILYVAEAQPPLPAGALSIVSDSRHLPANDAAERVYGLVLPLVDTENTIWYKKIDSTLRGNLGAELDAIFGALAGDGELPCAVISPAFPAYGRGLENGCLVHAGTHSRHIRLPELMQEQSAYAVAAISLRVVRQGIAVMARLMAKMHAGGANLLVVDAMCDEDLGCIACAAQNALPQRLFCGSAGLASVLAAQIVSEEGSESRWEPPSGLAWRSSNIVTVVGSGSTMAHRQIEYVRDQESADVIEVDLSTGKIWQGTGEEQTGNWLLHLPRPGPGTPLEGESARAMVAHLARTACGLMEESDAGLLIVVGGDSAVHLLNCLDIERLDVVEELLPGIPLTSGVDCKGRQRTIVLKAGNHGDEDTLDALMRMVRCAGTLVK